MEYVRQWFIGVLLVLIALAFALLLVGVIEFVTHCPSGCSCALLSHAKPDKWIACPGQRLKIERART